MPRTVSIQDIARRAGVSHTTVSRALRDSPLISQEVRAQIQQMAQEMGYIPNAVAQSLRGQRTGTVGLVVTSIADPFLGRVARGIEEVAQKYSISLLLSVSNNDADAELAVVENFHRRRVDGVIVAAARMTSEHEKQLARMGVPAVLINHQAETALEHLHSVSIDDEQGAREAVNHLLGLGHRAIGYLGAGNRPRSNRVRQQGYREALESSGVEPREVWICTTPEEDRYYADDVTGGQALLPRLAESGVTAVFCYNDMVAVGALTACRQMGLDVPGQMSIVGFDDVEMAQYVTPSLTTVHQPKLRLGQLAMEMLLDLVNGKTVVDHILPAELVVRESTGPAK